MILHIKYMVSLRCKMLVKEELRKLGINQISVDLGEVEIFEDFTEDQQAQFRETIYRSGLEVIDEKKDIIVNKIKNIIIESIHYSDEYITYKFSVFLSKKLGYDYKYLAKIFSEKIGITIEQYIIANKIERIKELLLYDELSIKEISYKLHYSSTAHLSNQFKKLTGLTPSYFKLLAENRRRIALEDI